MTEGTITPQGELIPEKRPDMISVLGILGFINTALFILIYGLGALAVGAVAGMDPAELDRVMEQAMASAGGAIDEAEMTHVMEVIRESGTMLMLSLLVLTIIRLVAIMKMWKQKKAGFYIYLPAQIARIFVVAMFMGFAYIGVFGPLLSIGMCALWGSQLKNMH